jgi:hypothetical protein
MVRNDRPGMQGGSARDGSTLNEFAWSYHLAALTRADDTTCVAAMSAATPRGRVTIFRRPRAAPVPSGQSA